MGLKRENLSVGKQYIAEIHRISENGNAIIDVDGGNHINAGPLNCSAGARIKIEVIKPHIGRCLTKSVIPDDYEEWKSLRQIQTSNDRDKNKRYGNETKLPKGISPDSLKDITDEQEDRDEAKDDEEYKSSPKKNNLISRRKP